MTRAAPIVAFALGAIAVGCSHGRGRPMVGAGAQVAETRDELLVATGDAVWRGDLTRRTGP